MRKSLYFLACILISVLVILPAQAGEQKTLRRSPKSIPCEEASRNAAKIKVGMKKSEVLDVLGSPTTRSRDKWSYDFGECFKPPRAGEQVTIGGDIFFREGVVSDIRWAWMDATGPGNVTPKKKP